MNVLIYLLDLFGVAVFAVTGALAAGQKKMDLFGVVVLANVTALGGGTLRDLVIGSTPVFWVFDPAYLVMASGTAVATFILVRLSDIPTRLLAVADAFGLAVFTVLGAAKALQSGLGGGIAVVTGLMTGVFGGMARDVLSGEIPLVLRREIYATASLGGAIVFVLLAWLGRTDLAVFVSIPVTLGLRLAAIKWNLSLPHFISRSEYRNSDPE